MIPIQILSIILLSPSALAQFAADGVQPDVTFGEGNDRFDLTEMIQATNRMYHQNKLDLEDDDARRNLRSNEEDLHILDDIHADETKTNTGTLAKRRSDDFAYHDKMESHEEGTKTDFERNLKHFMAKDVKKSRRMGAYMDFLHGDKGEHRRSDTSHHEQEVLMHYAMPIVMTIDGFMKVPLQ